jgi:hypothetical protein
VPGLRAGRHDVFPLPQTAPKIERSAAMEPRREQLNVPAPRPVGRPKRFRIIKLEERIAPGKGGNGSNNCPSASCDISCAIGTCTSLSIQ